MARDGDEQLNVFTPFRQFLALERDVFVLSLAMLAFSLAFQMTSRYVPEYLHVLGASAGVIGLYGSVGNVVSALYPYPGGALSDRIGSRLALTLFGTVATAGFVLWYAAPLLGAVAVPVVGVSLPVVGRVALGGTVEPWAWLFVGLFLTQAWKSFGLGATFAVVKQTVDADRLAVGFASTEVFRRIGFLAGPLLAAGVLALAADFVTGFQFVLLVAVAFGALATVAQHVLYDVDEEDSSSDQQSERSDDASEHAVGVVVSEIRGILGDLRAMPDALGPLLVADTLVRFANGMVYVFFVIVVTDFLAVGFDVATVSLRPDAFFGVLLAVEMVVALLSMLPAASVAERIGLKPVVAVGFAVYAVFPLALIAAPANQWLLLVLFAFSGLRFAGLPAHKALIVGPAADEAGGRVTGTYYLVRNALVIPSAALGGWLYGSDWTIPTPLGPVAAGPELAFSLATGVGLVGVAYFLAFGREFEPGT